MVRKIAITIDFSIDFLANGLQQHLIFLAETINCIPETECYWLYKGNQTDKDFVDKEKCIKLEEYLLDDSIDMDIIIMAGFYISNKDYKILTNSHIGTKYIVLHCGNKLIDDVIESLWDNGKGKKSAPPLLYVSQIWILPHFARNKEYIITYYKNENVYVVPLIWDTQFIEEESKKYTSKGINIEKQILNRISDVCIFEPNISITKNCIIPISIVERYEQKYPGKIKSCNIMNSKKLLKNTYFLSLISYLDLYKRKEVIRCYNRKKIAFALSNFGGLIISHQVFNDLNYLYFDALYLGAALVHNSPTISEYGYYYEDSNVNAAMEKVKYAIDNHPKNRTENRILANRLFHLYKPSRNSIVEKYAKLINKL